MTYNEDHECKGSDDLETTASRQSGVDRRLIAASQAAKSGADSARRFLDDLLYDLPNDAVVSLVIEEPLPGGSATETVWEDTVERLFGGDLDKTLESLASDARIFVDNRDRSGRVFAVATRGAVAQASYILHARDREVSVAVLEPPVVDDRLEDIEIPVPGCGGVSIAAGEGEPVDLDDVLDLYADALKGEEDVTPSDGGAVEWLDGTVEGSASDETWARKIILGTHESAKRPSGWRSLEGTLGMFGELMMQHCVEKKKDGKCILQGELLGDRRTKQAVRAMYVAALDLDTGETLVEIQAAVRELGRMAFVYSTFSHMKTKDDFARSDVLKFVEQQGEREITTPLLRRYLIERKGFKRSIADGAELIDPADHTEAGIRVTFSHPPCPKWRLFLPLAEPYVFVKRCDGDHRRAMEEWRGFLHDLAARLGVHLDPACVDPSRLYYTPRHRKGAPFACWAFLSDDLLDVDQDLEPVDPKSGDAFSAVGSKKSEKAAGAEIKNKWLFGWTKRYSHKFDAETFFQKYLPDYVLGDRASGPGLTIKCPNHLANSVHTEETEGGTFCAPAEDDRPFTIHCCHAHCNGIDRLQMLDILLGEGAIQKRDLFDPDCLALEADEPEPPEWNPKATADRIDELVTKYEKKDLRLGEFMRQFAAIEGLEKDEIAQTLDRIKATSKMKIDELRKEYDEAWREAHPAGSVGDDGDEVPTKDEAFAAAMREALGGDYAVICIGGSVGVVDMDASRKGLKSIVPVVMSKDHFKLFTANRRLVLEEPNGREKVYHDVAGMFFVWEDRPTFNALVFEPEKPCPADCLNAWRGFTYDGRERGKGDWGKLREHVFENVCQSNQEYYDWLMLWIADILQHPGSKPGSGVVTRGAKGAGKTFLFDVVRHVTAPYSLRITSQGTLVNDFNDHLFGRLFVVAEESVWGGDKKHEGKIKALITENRMEFSKKFFSIVEVSNYTRYAFTSNEDWVIPTDFGRERRFLMLDVSDAQVGNPEYFGAIQAELDAGGYEAFVYDMMRLEPPEGMSWESLRQAPQTDALNSQKLRGMTPGQEFFVDIVNSGTAPLLDASADFEPQPARLSITDRNRVHWPAIRQAYYEHVKNAGSHREARPSLFATYAAKILLAENDGKPMTARNALGAPASAAAWNGSKQADHRGDAIAFPGLQDIVDTHHEAGRLRFDPRWGEHEIVDEDE